VGRGGEILAIGGLRTHYFFSGSRKGGGGVVEGLTSIKECKKIRILA